MSWVLEDVVPNLTLLTLVKYSGVLSYTLLWLEMTSTLPDEVKYIWPSRWSFMKAVFFINRYTPLVDLTLNISLVLYTTNPQSCKIQYDILAGSYVFGSLASEAIIMARTMALYNFSIFVILLMGAAGLGILIPSIVICHSFLSQIDYPDAAILRFIGGCVPTVEARPVWVLYTCLMASETIVVLLTLGAVKVDAATFAAAAAASDLTQSPMYQTPSERKHRSPLVHTMYRDGSLYYVVLLMFSIANLCFMLLAPKAASSVIQMPFRVVHSTMCSRVLLNLRKVAAKLTDMSYDEFRQSRLAFGPGVRDAQRTSSDSLLQPLRGYATGRRAAITLLDPTSMLHVPVYSGAEASRGLPKTHSSSIGNASKPRRHPRSVVRQVILDDEPVRVRARAQEAG
ncbi:hypothetical protein VTO73DRAFT_6998 [Trametes versicolor]